MPAQHLEKLQNLLNTLLSPNGCPWDKEQTPLSLCEYFIEESHEFVDAIRHGSLADVVEEAGDTLFLLLFICTLYQQKGSFTLRDALAASVEKMTRRHPHVFGDSKVNNVEDVHANWAQIKKSEKARKAIFSELPPSLPALTKSYRIHSKAAGAGFTWENDLDAELQVETEWLEFLDAIANGDLAAQSHELGDLLFSLVELGRRKGIKANEALEAANHRFLSRFDHMEKNAQSCGQEFSSLSMEEKNLLWDKAKEAESKTKQGS